MFSRNASSSRAIPVAKMIESIEKDPALPIHWGKNQSGMQAREEITDVRKGNCESIWQCAMEDAIGWVENMIEQGLHKQVANRLLEPWMHIDVVCTATDYNNFFALRHHHMAQPEIAELARQMWELYRNSSPWRMEDGEWHLPYTDRIYNSEKTMNIVRHYAIHQNLPGHLINRELEVMKRVSVANCARVSYAKHGVIKVDGEDGYSEALDKDLKLYDRLVGHHPIHASPAEHQAMAVSDPNVRSGNLRGWIQLRKTLPDENITNFEGPLK